MTEAANHPQSGAETPHKEHVATQTERGGQEMETLPPLTTETYHPLSLLALTGFGLAVAYSVIILVGGLVALVGKVPWLLPLWTFAIPIVVLLVCWAARNRIRDSEGVLTGSAFTTWGARVTVLVALMYAMYSTFTFFAVRLQATDFADRIFEQLKKGNTEQAFALAMAMSNASDMANLRETIEMRYNTTSGKQGANGAFTRFRQSQFVRYIVMAGDQARITPLGVVEWGHEKNGYQVVLKYLVVTPLVEFEVTVDALGQDSKPGEPKGRQWGIDFARGGMSVDKQTLKLSPRGKELLRDKPETAAQFVMNWVERINKRDWSEAYLDTLPRAEREHIRAGISLLGAAPVSGLAPVSLLDADSRAFLSGERSLAKSDLIHFDEKHFWASSSLRTDVRRRIGRTFQPPSSDSPNPFVFRLPPQVTPIVRERDGLLTMQFDLEIRYMSETSPTMDYVVDTMLVVTEDGRAANSNQPAWRIASIEADSARTPPIMKKEIPSTKSKPVSDFQQ